jgi:hypothetical protein
MLDLPATRLALLIAIATAFGGVLAAFIDNLFLDANVEHQANVQLVELAIGILSEPVESDEDGVQFVDSPEAVLRGWAVDTLNEVALVQFDAAARELLVNGRVHFNWPDAVRDINVAELVRQIEAASEAMESNRLD